MDALGEGRPPSTWLPFQDQKLTVLALFKALGKKSQSRATGSHSLLLGAVRGRTEIAARGSSRKDALPKLRQFDMPLSARSPRRPVRALSARRDVFQIEDRREVDVFVCDDNASAVAEGVNICTSMKALPCIDLCPSDYEIIVSLTLDGQDDCEFGAVGEPEQRENWKERVLSAVPQPAFFDNLVAGWYTDETVAAFRTVANAAVPVGDVF